MNMTFQPNDQLLHTLFDAVPDGISVLDADMTIVSVNKTMEALYAHTAPLKGQKCYQAYHGRSEPCKICPTANAIQSGKPEIREVPKVRADGSLGILELHAYPMKDETGKVYQIVEYVRDISKIRHEEEEKKVTEERYRLLLENANDAILVAQDGVLKYANPSTEKMLGYSKEELSCLPFTEIIHPDDRAEIIGRYQNMLAGQKKDTSHTFQVKNKSGPLLSIEINSVHIEWDRKPAVLCFCRDVTLTRKMEQRLTHSQKIEAIGTLAGGIAHDINNILAPIMGYSEMCLADTQPDSPMARRIRRILQAAHRAKDLVHQILTFSHQEPKKQIPVRLNPIIREAMKLLRASIPSTIEFKQSLYKETGAIMADPTQIHQIIMNLCMNAAHSMREKGGILEVHLSDYSIGDDDPPAYAGLPHGQYVRLTVSDTGHGIDREVLKRIFDPYFTTKAQGEGTGMGLSVVHGIVTGFGGAIKVYSEPEIGTTFQVYFPKIDFALDENKQSEVKCPEGTETILLVDDETVILDMTTEILEGLGYTIVSMAKSEDALQTFRANPDRFDLVLTDQTMPRMDGIELATEILQIKSDIPIILCSGFSTGVTEEKIASTGIRALLNKPSTRQEMSETIRKALDSGDAHVYR